MEIRTTCPNNYNKYYMTKSMGGWNNAIQGKPTKSDANVLSNCVGYANGRFAEIIGKDKVEYQLVCNAENFIEKAKAYGLQISDKPSLGGIMVWEGKGSLAGHVAIVERIDSEKEIFTSESAYNGSAFYNKNRNNSSGNWGMSNSYAFRGCIINPSNPTPPTPPTPSGNERIKGIQRILNSRYNTNLVVDGIYGLKTKKAFIIGLQKELNRQYNAHLVVDGIFGPKTKSKCPTVRVGAEGNITWLIQAHLFTPYNYDITIDSRYGLNTSRTVKKFQSEHGLIVDGVCGKNTFERLFK